MTRFAFSTCICITVFLFVSLSPFISFGSFSLVSYLSMWLWFCMEISDVTFHLVCEIFYLVYTYTYTSAFELIVFGSFGHIDNITKIRFDFFFIRFSVSFFFDFRKYLHVHMFEFKFQSHFNHLILFYSQ